MIKTDELRTARIDSLVTPAELAARYPVTEAVAGHVLDARRRIEKILNGDDQRLLVIIGPCSIHDPRARSITQAAWRSCGINMTPALKS